MDAYVIAPSFSNHQRSDSPLSLAFNIIWLSGLSGGTEPLPMIDWHTLYGSASLSLQSCNLIATRFHLTVRSQASNAISFSLYCREWANDLSLPVCTLLCLSLATYLRGIIAGLLAINKVWPRYTQNESNMLTQLTWDGMEPATITPKHGRKYNRRRRQQFWRSNEPGNNGLPFIGLWSTGLSMEHHFFLKHVFNVQMSSTKENCVVLCTAQVILVVFICAKL